MRWCHIYLSGKLQQQETEVFWYYNSWHWIRMTFQQWGSSIGRPETSKPPTFTRLLTPKPRNRTLFTPRGKFETAKTHFFTHKTANRQQQWWLTGIAVVKLCQESRPRARGKVLYCSGFYLPYLILHKFLSFWVSYCFTIIKCRTIEQ